MEYLPHRVSYSLCRPQISIIMVRLWDRSSAWLERRPVKAKVGGSSPLGPATSLPGTEEHYSMSEQLKKLTNPDTLVSLFLGLSVFIVAAIMVTNIIGARKNEKTTQEKKANEQQAQNQQKLPATYTVVSGDTLWSIAEKTIGSGYNYVDIAAANKLSDANSITEGQKLSIPNVAKKEPGQKACR